MVSGQELKKDGSSPRVDQKLRQKYKDIPGATGDVLIKDIPGRQKILDWETDKVKDYKDNNRGQRPPRQIRPNP